MGEGDTGWCIQATTGGAGVPVQVCGCEGAGVGERRVGVEKGGATEWTGEITQMQTGICMALPRRLPHPDPSSAEQGGVSVG